MCAGLEQVVDYVNNLHFDKEDLDYLDGLNVFGKEFIERLKTSNSRAIFTPCPKVRLFSRMSRY